MIKQKHPKGLYVLFFTEMWERFSFYGMRALLVLYMTQYLFIEVEKGKEVFGFHALKGFLETVFGPLNSQALSSQIYGLYTGFVYFTPFFGGIIADRLLGQRRSVYVGAFLMAIGHFLMAVESQFLLALWFCGRRHRYAGGSCRLPLWSTVSAGGSDNSPANSADSCGE